MDRDTASALTGRAALSQRTGSADLCGKMHHSTWLKWHVYLIRTTNQLVLPIQVKGRFGKASAIAHGPGLAVHLYVRRTLPDPQTTQVRPIDVQFAQDDPLACQILPDRLSHAGFWDIGCCHANSADQAGVQVVEHMALVPIDTHTAA